MPSAARFTRPGILLLVTTCWWLANGIANATHWVLESRAMGNATRWEQALTQTLTTAILWIPITMLAVRLVGRWPIERAHLPRALAIHTGAAAGVILARAVAVLVLRTSALR